MFEWLIFSLLLFGVWFVIFVIGRSLRREMLLVSAFTAPFGLAEPIFIPAYWAPPSLFDLAVKVHLDVESLIFCFASGGIAAVLYEAVFRFEHEKMEREISQRSRTLHRLAVVSPVFAFAVMYLFSGWNPIYVLSMALLAGGVATALCRRDLAWNTLVGGALFLGLYFVFFFLITLVFPDFVRYWNLRALSGVLVAGVPLEELLFAFSFGTLWSSVYEHVLWVRLSRKRA